MDGGLAVLFLFAIILGVFTVIAEDLSFRKGNTRGVKSSKDLVSYLLGRDWPHLWTD